jgi:hypothetical protein
MVNSKPLLFGSILYLATYLMTGTVVGTLGGNGDSGEDAVIDRVVRSYSSAHAYAFSSLSAEQAGHCQSRFSCGVLQDVD